MIEPKLLSECGSVYVIDDTPDNRYQIEIDSGDYLVVCAGVTSDKRMAKFSHANMAASNRDIFEFKHYRSNGGKYWTARAGVNFYFVIPRSAITILPEKGYSYIRAEINGVKVHFSVSGGTQNGWTDWLHINASIMINHGMRDLKKIAEVAVRNTIFEPIVLKVMDASEEMRWKRLAASSSKGLVDEVVKMVEDGKKPIVKFLDGYREREGNVVRVERRRRKVAIPPMHDYQSSYRWEYTGAVKRFITLIDWRCSDVSVRMNQIDWQATAEANGLTI